VRCRSGTATETRPRLSGSLLAALRKGLYMSRALRDIALAYCALRLAVQDIALSRRKHGFDSRRARQVSSKVQQIRKELHHQVLRPAAVVSSGRIIYAHFYEHHQKRARRLPCAQEGAEGARASRRSGNRHSEVTRCVVEKKPSHQRPQDCESPRQASANGVRPHFLAKAEALSAERPLRTTLSDKEIDRIAEYHFAAALAEDDETRREGTGSEPLFQSVARQLADAGVKFNTQFRIGAGPEYGLSEREMQKRAADLEADIALAQHALARGDISAIREQMEELLFIFRLNLAPKSDAYRKLGMAVLRKDVEALRAIERRDKGEPIETPKVPTADAEPASNGETLGAAVEGWKKSKNPRPYALREFTYAINRFTELHGDMPVQAIGRKTVREFREALQQMPLRRVGSLRRATLPELVNWSRRHPEAQKVSPATVNKLLGAAQAVVVWARNNGLIPDDVPWADPFSRMRLEEAEPGREPWEAGELRVLFGSPVFIEGIRPKAGGGEAAFWLPLLGIFTGARLGELAPLTAADVVKDDATGILTISIIEDAEYGKRLKTRSSRRVIPLHPELVRLGFVDFVEKAKRERGRDARLFPLLSPGPRGGFGEAWSKWFGRYIRGLGITSKHRVYHSFRHGFKDALRTARISEDVNDALTGHAGGKPWAECLVGS
jgi:integrase